MIPVLEKPEIRHVTSFNYKGWYSLSLVQRGSVLELTVTNGRGRWSFLASTAWECEQRAREWIDGASHDC